MKGFPFGTRTTNSVRLTLGSQYSLCENYIKRARLLRGLKQVLGTNLIPLRTKFDTQTKRVPAWPVINQLWFPERHFSAKGISLRLGEVQMKFYGRSLQALLSPAPRGFAARSRVLARLVINYSCWCGAEVVWLPHSQSVWRWTNSFIIHDNIVQQKWLLFN